ncbi:Presenilin [Fasciolopsis buskii]|uniref:Presenilin n=1 Tax=Fasciolopsis buskii TaxID=27845 RepID=A0A8E0RRP4_9TREM|nr:Presenilin [Fasciolopsis buski]
MMFVVIVASTVDFYSHTDHYLIYTPFHTPDADVGTQTWQTIANTLIFMSFIVVMTFVLVLLFKYSCYKLIRGWLVVTTFFLLFFFAFIFFTEVVDAMGIFVDYITMVFLLWNFGVVGMMAIHWRGPLIVQQAYLIFVSAQIALLFLKYLPKWTCWLLLAALAVWDLVAVLAPRGPLRMLVEMAHERQQPLFPALLYSTTAVYLVGMTDSKDDHTTEQPAVHPPTTPLIDLTTGESHSRSSSTNCETDPGVIPDRTQLLHANNLSSSGTDSGSARLRHTAQFSESTRPIVVNTNTSSRRHDSERADVWREVQLDLREREERGVKLGLGDFVFYSLLIGRATLDGDATTVVTCYVAILVGMCVTIIVLGVTRRALPALPISIACGILFYFVTSLVISPFLEALSAQRLIL